LAAGWFSRSIQSEVGKAFFGFVVVTAEQNALWSELPCVRAHRLAVDVFGENGGEGAA
jgi:hypothetical protein